MNPEEINRVEAERQKLLARLQEAETSLRRALHVHGFCTTPRLHLERAIAHIQEAYIAINESKAVRSVHQLVDDLTRIQQVVADAKRGRSQRI